MRNVALIFALMISACNADVSSVKPGMSVAEVEKALGAPESKSPWFGGEIYVYGKSGVLIRDGKVVKIESDVLAEQDKLDAEIAKLSGLVK